MNKARAVVTRDLPDGAASVGVPARPLQLTGLHPSNVSCRNRPARGTAEHAGDFASAALRQCRPDAEDAPGDVRPAAGVGDGTAVHHRSDTGQVLRPEHSVLAMISVRYHRVTRITDVVWLEI